DGGRILAYQEAKDIARDWAKDVAAGKRSVTPGLTVDAELDRYLEARAAEGRKSIEDARQRAAQHIRPKLDKLLATERTVEQVRRWHQAMAKAPKQLRTKKFAAKPNYQATDITDPEVQRRRRDTANRTLTTLKAALNWARDNQLVEDDTAWRLTKPFR